MALTEPHPQNIEGHTDPAGTPPPGQGTLFDMPGSGTPPMEHGQPAPTPPETMVTNLDYNGAAPTAQSPSVEVAAPPTSHKGLKEILMSRAGRGGVALLALITAGSVLKVRSTPDTSGFSQFGPAPTELPADDPHAEQPSTTEETEPAHNPQLDIYERTLDDGPTFTVTRPNGEVIEVPRLRRTGNISDFTYSALAVLSAYMTTGDEQALREFTQDAETQKHVKRYRQIMYERVRDNMQPYDRPEELVASIYTDTSSADAAATFRQGVDVHGNQAIWLDTGDLYITINQDYTNQLKTAWNSPAIRSYGEPNELPLTTFRMNDVGFVFVSDPRTGERQITGINLGIEERTGNVSPNELQTNGPSRSR